MGLLRLFGRLVNVIAGLFGRNVLRDLDRLQVLYSRMDDDQLRDELDRIMAARELKPAAVNRWSLLSRFQDFPALHALAIGVCLFDRYPCDLPPGSKSYEEQRLAAQLLTVGTNVQMETGEGKTYAIALAATAMLAVYPQVIIITANDYLARRDRVRVSHYFEAAQIACEYGVPSPDYRGVSYTTLRDVCFEYLQRQYRSADSTLPDYSIQAAVIIDEIDSVLLDQSLVHDLVRILPSDESLWGSVFGLAEAWKEREYTYNALSDEFALTADAWDEIVRLAHETGKPASLLMKLAAAALWARQAKEGRHYHLDGDNVQLINQVTGEPYNSSDVQVGALEYLIFRRHPPVSITVAEIDGLTLLRRHPHVVGLSGTAVQDTIYYLQQLGTLTATVAPHFPRYPGKVITLAAASREAALGHIADRITEVSPRPVVIGTWSPAQARAVADGLRTAKIVSDSDLGVITAFDSQVDADILNRAGEPGRVTVLSQGGSRGVDVRSTHQPLLLVLGRAVEPRLDRQFLGRVGRHGEAFDAEFIIDPNSPVQIPVRFAAKLYGGIMPFNAAMARGLAQRQRDAWTYKLARRQHATILSRAVGDVEATVAAEFRRLRALDNGASLRGYVTELCNPATADGGATTPDMRAADRVDALAQQARVISAIERREASDNLVTQFETAVRATGIVENSYQVPATERGEPAELIALTRWLTRSTGQLAIADDPAQMGLFRSQAMEASQQHLPAPSSPYSRSPVDVIFETRVMANATMLEQTKHRLDSLRVTSSAEAYCRRGAFTARNLNKLSELAVRRSIIGNLSLADHPAMLDELYYSVDHQIFPTRSDRDSRTVFPSTTPAATMISGSRAETLVSQFLKEREEDPGGLPIPPESARLLLLDVIRPLMGTASLISAALLGQRIALILDSLAASGTRGARLRDHRKLIFAFTDSLYDQGILKHRVTREAAITSAIRRMREFTKTIPRLGVVSALVYLAVLAIGVLPIATQARHVGFFETATRLFGFGVAFPGRPFLAFFAVVVAIEATARACGFDDPNLLASRLAPILTIPFSLAFYGRGAHDIGSTILLIFGLIIWSVALFTVNRFVITLIGTDANLFLAAISVLVYLIVEVMKLQAGVSLFVVIGVIAATSGPAVPVSIASREYAKGVFVDTDDRAKTRVLLDPNVTSGLAALLAVTLIARFHGNAATIGFTVLELTVFAVMASLRLNAGRIKGTLAKLQVGTPLTDQQLKAYLRRAVVRSVLLAAIALSAAVVITGHVGESTATGILLGQWAGVLFFTGTVSAYNALSVAGATTPLLASHEDEEGLMARLRELRNQLRAWRRARFAWVWKTAVTVVVLFGMLRWISDLFGVTDILHSAWHLVDHLFLPEPVRLWLMAIGVPVIPASKRRHLQFRDVRGRPVDVTNPDEQAEEGADLQWSA